MPNLFVNRQLSVDESTEGRANEDGKKRTKRKSKDHCHTVIDHLHLDLVEGVNIGRLNTLEFLDLLLELID